MVLTASALSLGSPVLRQPPSRLCTYQVNGFHFNFGYFRCKSHLRVPTHPTLSPYLFQEPGRLPEVILLQLNDLVKTCDGASNKHQLDAFVRCTGGVAGGVGAKGPSIAISF